MDMRFILNRKHGMHKHTVFFSIKSKVTYRGRLTSVSGGYFSGSIVLSKQTFPASCCQFSSTSPPYGYIGLLTPFLFKSSIFDRSKVAQSSKIRTPFTTYSYDEPVTGSVGRMKPLKGSFKSSRVAGTFFFCCQYVTT